MLSHNLHLARKLVSVAFTGFGFALPTFNFGFCNGSESAPEVINLTWSYLEVFFLALFLFLRACGHGGVRVASCLVL